MRSLTIIILVFVVAVIAYVVFFASKQIKRLKNTCIGIKKVSFKAVGIKGSRLNLILTAKNKSDIEFEIVEQNYRIYINNKFLSKVYSDKKVKLPVGQVVETPFNVDFNPLKVLGAAFANLITDPSRVIIKITGEMKVKMGIFTFGKVPVDLSFTLKEIYDLKKRGAEPC